MRHDEFAVVVFEGVRKLLAESVTPERVRDTVRHLDVGDNLLLPSSAEVRTQLVWGELQEWLADDGKLLEDYPLELVEGICGAQAHSWIAVHTKVHDRRQDPVTPVFLIDVTPADVFPGPLLIGPGAPIRLCYYRRKTPKN